MIAVLDDLVGELPPIDLVGLDAAARLLTRRDRKYLLDPARLTAVLRSLPPGAAALEIDGRRSFRYESIYFDTPDRASYRQAATGRPRRFKVRVRRYVDSDIAMLEVKTRDRRGQTVKRRIPTTTPFEGFLDVPSSAWLAEFPEVAPHLAALRPAVTTRYTRSTVVFPAIGARATVDTELRCIDADGRECCAGPLVILESKAGGAPSVIDRALWDRGVRPTRMSKFAFGLAVLEPELPSNRWHRALRIIADGSAGTGSIHQEL